MTSRLRMFAGPNGSGKSTLKTVLPEDLLGVYINPDEMEKSLRSQSYINLKDFEVKATADEWDKFYQQHRLPISNQSYFPKKTPILDMNRVLFEEVEANSYQASVIADFIRVRLLAQGTSFTLETVMSHKSKVELLENAKRIGYRTYLYFVATDDPQINVARVAGRVNQGGHPVPKDKITSRYYKSLELLRNAIKATNRAYLFDNSTDGSDHSWIAEITEGTELEYKSNFIPGWVKQYVLGE